jgi:hypothetical protein
MLHTTINLCKKSNACVGTKDHPEGIAKLAIFLGGSKKYGEDTPIPLRKIVESNGLEDALWTLRCTIGDSTKFRVTFACDCAWRVLPIYESKHPGDMRVRTCIETTRKYMRGEATKSELNAARAAARAAAYAAAAAAVYAAAAADADTYAAAAADAAADTYAAANAAVYAAAAAAAYTYAAAAAAAAAAAVYAAAAADAAYAADTAYAAERKWQTGHFLELLNQEEKNAETK